MEFTRVEWVGERYAIRSQDKFYDTLAKYYFVSKQIYSLLTTQQALCCLRQKGYHIK